MTVVNELDRWHLAIDVLERTRALGGGRHEALVAELRAKLAHHAEYVWEEGVDVPEVTHWKWGHTAEDQTAPNGPRKFDTGH
jgi:xylulose-5-phosphate/fructose-6-phosphate phosphoketolase